MIDLSGLIALKKKYYSISEAAVLFGLDRYQLHAILKKINISSHKKIIKSIKKFNKNFKTGTNSPVCYLDGLDKDQLIKVYHYLRLRGRLS